jgi:hypothetical protein
MAPIKMRAVGLRRQLVVVALPPMQEVFPGAM